MLEMTLEADFRDYTIKVMQDLHQQTTTVTVVFSTLEDAVFFKLMQNI